MDKIAKMDDYVIEHFRLAFGNRIVKQLKDFVPAYIACGGEEIVAVDYLIANKILRKCDFPYDFCFAGETVSQAFGVGL